MTREFIHFFIVKTCWKIDCEAASDENHDHVYSFRRHARDARHVRDYPRISPNFDARSRNASSCLFEISRKSSALEKKQADHLPAISAATKWRCWSSSSIIKTDWSDFLSGSSFVGASKLLRDPRNTDFKIASRKKWQLIVNGYRKLAGSSLGMFSSSATVNEKRRKLR